MSLHKLTAGSGYDYLTRQVAALDATDKGPVATPLVDMKTHREIAEAAGIVRLFAGQERAQGDQVEVWLTG